MSSGEAAARVRACKGCSVDVVSSGPGRPRERCENCTAKRREKRRPCKKCGNAVVSHGRGRARAYCKPCHPKAWVAGRPSNCEDCGVVTKEPGAGRGRGKKFCDPCRARREGQKDLDVSRSKLLTCKACERRYFYKAYPSSVHCSDRCRLESRGEQRKRMRTGNANHRASKALSAAKLRAKRKGIPFSLDPKRIRGLYRAGICQATGIPFSLEDRVDGHMNPWAPSLDRIDPAGGYTDDNTWVVCCIFNLAKSDFAMADVVAMARALLLRNAADFRCVS